MSGYLPGDEFQCLSIPIVIIKKPADDLSPPKFGFTITGGIDCDLRQSHGYKDIGIYVLRTDPQGPAHRAGLRAGDRILQCNGHDFTLCTHRKAVECILNYQILNLLVQRDSDSANV